MKLPFNMTRSFWVKSEGVCKKMTLEWWVKLGESGLKEIVIERNYCGDLVLAAFCKGKSSVRPEKTARDTLCQIIMVIW